MARLILVTAEGQQAVDLRPVNSLGRHPNNSIQLLDKIVSKEHCIVELRGDHFVLRDLGSLNGTYINGERVQGEQGLRHGDEIALGSTRARFEDPAAMSPAQGVPAAGQRFGTPAPASAARPFQQPPPSVGQPSMGQPPMGQPPMGQPPQPPMGHPLQGMPPSFQGGASPLARSGASDLGAYGLPAGFPGAAQPGQVNRSNLNQTRIEVQAQDRAIGTQIAAVHKGFLPFDQVASNPAQLRDDYERLRMSHELSREIALERDTTKLLEKILSTIFKFTRADRGCVFLRDHDTGEMRGMVSRRRDGSDAPITVSSTILNHVIKERAAVLTHDAAMDFAAAKGKSMILNRISSAIVVPLMHNDDALGILWLDSESLAVFQPKDLELVTAVANQAAMFIEINILGKKVESEIVARERFARLVSPNVAEQIASGALKIEKGGSLVKECTVFNSDIRGFTRMSEGTPPEVVVEMLNDYFEMMVESIFQYEGTLDKFMGDGIMALWGAPVQHPDDGIRSVRCAIEQMDALGRFNRRRIENGQPPISIGIGIHTGELVAGYVGSSKALSYTVIGDTANTSARLCGIAESGQIVVSESTMAQLGNRFETEELPPARLKGKEKPMRIFNVVRERTAVAVQAVPPGELSFRLRRAALACGRHCACGGLISPAAGHFERPSAGLFRLRRARRFGVVAGLRRGGVRPPGPATRHCPGRAEAQTSRPLRSHPAPPQALRGL
jgi:adenylate cyclase